MRYSELTSVPVEFQCRVQSFKSFFPKGPTDDGKSHREDDLVQVWTDTGMRTIGLSNIYRVTG